MNLRRAAKVFAGLIAALLLLALLAWAVVPSLLKSQLESRGSAMLGRALKVGAVEFSPWALSLTVRELTLAAADAKAPPQLSIARLFVDIDSASLWRLAPVLQALEIDAPKLRVARLADHRWDFDDVLQRLDKPAPTVPEEPARFALYNLQLRDGEVLFDDRTVQRQHALQKLQVALPFLSNLPADITVKVEPRLAFTLDNTAVDLRGQTLPFAPERTTELQLQLGQLELARWWPYLPKTLPLTPQGGTLAGDLALRFSQPSGRVAQLALRGALSLDKLSLQRAGQPMLSWQKLAVQLADVRPLERRVALGVVRLEGAEVDVRRNANGQIDWTSLGGSDKLVVEPEAPGKTPAKKAEPAKPEAPWAVSAQKLEIAAAQVRWADAQLRPAAQFAIDSLNLSIDGPQWPADAAVPVALDARVSSANKPVVQLKLNGTASPNMAELQLDASELQLATLAPYLKAQLRPALEGRANVQALLHWAAGDAPKLQIELPQLKLEALRLVEPGAGKGVAAASINSVTLQNASIDLRTQQLKLGALRIDKPVFALRRDSSGRLSVNDWVVASPSPAATTSGKPDSPPWRAELAELAIDNGQVALTDAAAVPGTLHNTTLRALRLRAQALRWPGTAAASKFQLSAALAAPRREEGGAAPDGKLDASGSLALAPLALRSTLVVSRLPVHAFEPYFAALMPVHLARAELNWRGDVAYQQTAAGASVEAKGEALVADLNVRTKALDASAAVGSGDELLSWQSLTLKPLRFVMVPAGKPKLEIGDLALTNFYSRLTITEQGRFNLSAVQPPGAAAASAPAQPPKPAAPAASAPAAPRELPIELVINGTQLSGGKVDFNDRFIRPNYSAALSDLEGRIGRLASGTRDMATVDLKGRVAGTGLLDIRGAVNPTADPLALDITARATDLELAPLSPYSGKYAGYAIERGKLSVDVAYRIDADGKLEARNQIVLNQLTFGDKVDSPEATKLPVRFALALLTDRNGVIDINLPVSGSINDPQFSVFGIVLKIIGNLIVKAITSPFALFSGGGSEELSVVEFVPGTAQLAASSGAVIDKVAKALIERPALRMTVAGSADPSAERRAMQAAAVEAKVQTEQRRERARGGADVSPQTSLPALTNEERTRLVRRIYTDTPLPDKPRNLIGLVKEIPLPQMQQMLEAAVPANADIARELALQRGLAVRDALIAKGLPSERLFLGAPKLHGEAAPAPEAKAEASASAAAPALAAASAPAPAPTPAPTRAWVPSVQLTLSGP
jgi:uncharacterized protein involved in outer membrane biogenesis